MPKLGRNILYNIGYQLLTIFIPLITSPYLSRTLGTNGAGIYSYSLSVANYFLLFAMLGITNYGNKSIAACKEDRVRRNTVFSSLYFFQAVWAACVTVAYAIYYVFWVKDNPLVTAIQGLYVLSALFDISWLFFGVEEFKFTVMRNCFVKVIALLLVFVFVKSENDVWKYALITAGGTVASQIILWANIHKYVDFVKVDKDEIRANIKPVFVLFIPVISYSIYKLMDKIMLGNMTNMSAVGIYEYAEKIINLPLGVISAVGTVMLPRISSLAADGKESRVKNYFAEAMKYMSWICCAMAFGFMGVGRVFAPIFYGKDFYQSGLLIEALSITLIFISWANVIRTQYLIPYGKNNIYVVSTVIGAILNLLINTLLIPKYSIYGAAAGTIVAEFCVMFVQVLGTRKEIDYKKIMKMPVGYIIIGVAMCGVTKIAGSFFEDGVLKLAVMILVGAVFYIVSSVPYMIIRDGNKQSLRLLKKK